MTFNLVAEVVKKGHKANQAARIIADIIGCTEKTARNKINGITDFTVPEALAINEILFANQFEVGYLFDQAEEAS